MPSDDQNRLIGRRIPQNIQLSTVHESATSVGDVDFLSVGRVPAADGVTHISMTDRASSNPDPNIGFHEVSSSSGLNDWVSDMAPGSIARRSVTTTTSYVVLSPHAASRVLDE